MGVELRVDAAAFSDLRLGVVDHALHQQHELALALVGISSDAGVQFAQTAGQHGFEQLGQLAGDGCGAVRAEGDDGIGQGLLDAVRGFVEDQRARFAGQLR